jgi:hypothetical protein
MSDDPTPPQPPPGASAGVQPAQRSEGAGPLGGIHVEERTLDTKTGPRVIAIGKPVHRAVLDRRRLEKLRTGEFKSRTNDFMIAALAARATPLHAVIFRAGGDGGGHNEIADDVSDDEVIEFGSLMVGQQLSLYERAARHGVLVLVGIEFGQREVMGYDKGASRLAAALEQRLANASQHTPGELAEARLHLWLLDHLAMWTGLSLDAFMADKLPVALAGAERSTRALSRLLSELDEARKQ